ncbi:hypothetical protein HY771_03195 [Candidatus Uhrbacteria bacterium]|nr:hypothetical protein [Candidatus Uhrbacteria bacterium]
MGSHYLYFDKPMKELREAFVQTRLAQTDVFGRFDIEPWLANERTQEVPQQTVWIFLLANIINVSCYAENVIDGATLFSDSGYETEGFSPIYNCLGRFYIGSSNPDTCSRAIADVLFYEWNRKRPKWREARGFLCDILAVQIRYEREKAEKDFDSAVAVSVNGTKIVHADWVIWISSFGGLSTYHVYQSSEIGPNKLVRPVDDSFRRVSLAEDICSNSAIVTPQLAIIIANRVKAYLDGYRKGLSYTIRGILIECALQERPVRVYVTSLFRQELDPGGIQVVM